MPTSNDDDVDRRRRSIPLWGSQFDWWTAAVKASLKQRGIEQVDLAADINEDPGAVSRCITRKQAVYEILIAISDKLDLPYPVILPESQAEALHLATQRRLFRRDLQMEQIKAGVTETPTESQSPAVDSHDVGQQKSKRKTLAIGRRRRVRPG